MTRLSRPNTAVIMVAAVVICGIAPFWPAWLDLAVLAGILSLIALSAGLSFGQAGVLSMAQGAFAAIGAYATAIVTTRMGWPPIAGLALALFLPALLAWVLARLVGRMAPLATALATLALGTVIEVILRSWDDVTGGFVGIVGIPPVSGFESAGAFVWLVWLFVVAAVAVTENLMRSAYGRALNSVRHDRLRAVADGVAVEPLLSAMLALSASMAGAAGWLYAHYITYLNPQSLDTHASLSALLMAVVGGAAFVLGPVLGTVLLTLLGKFLPAQEAQGLFYGGALILILIVAPDGIVGGATRWRDRMREARRSAAPVASSDAEAAAASASTHGGIEPLARLQPGSDGVR